MANCVHCEKTGSWVKQYGLFKNSTRRLRICKECLAAYWTIEVTLPEQFRKEVIRIVETTAEFPKKVLNAGPTLDLLNRILELSMTIADPAPILRPLQAIVDQVPLPTVDPDPAHFQLPGFDPNREARLREIIARINACSPVEAEARETPAQDSPKETAALPKSRYAKSREEAETEFRNAFAALESDGSVSVRDMMDFLGLARRTVQVRIQKMPGDFVLKKGRIYRVEHDA